MPIRKEVKRYWKMSIEALKDNVDLRNDKENFPHSGIHMFIGFQGSGKTMSMVDLGYQLALKYPKAVIVTNVKLTWELRNTVFEFIDVDELAYLMENIQNNKYGCIFIIDEIHGYYNALDSKNIPLSTFNQISQQRKNKTLILCASQLFLRVAKPFREQCMTIIACKTHFGLLTTQTVYDAKQLTTDMDGGIIANKVGGGFFWQSRMRRERYDTYQRINRGPENMTLYEVGRVLDQKQARKGRKL